MPSAEGIITYVGVPMAVVGLLPIVWNAVVTAIHWYKIKRTLKFSRLPARLRVDGFNRIVEVQLARYLIRPVQVDNQSGDLWDPHDLHSNVDGSTWRLLEWDMRKIGEHTQRTYPGDSITEPRAKVSFRDVITYLYSLGAMPVYEGWSELQSKRLWTRRGCVLMTVEASPGLLVSSLEDFIDAQLSLELSTAPPWSQLLQSRSSVMWESTAFTLPSVGLERCQTTSASIPSQDFEPKSHARKLPHESAWSSAQPSSQCEGYPIMCSVSKSGLTSAYFNKPSGLTVANDGYINIDHLLIRTDRSTQGIWFASCAAALYFRSSTPVLAYKIPEFIIQMISLDTIPRDIIGLLNSPESPSSPSWSPLHSLSKHPSGGSEAKSWQSSHALEDPKIAELREEIIAEDEMQYALLQSTLQGPILRHNEVAVQTLKWLIESDILPADTSLHGAVRQIMSHIVTNKIYSASLTNVLDRWAAWTATGSMSINDLLFVKISRREFAEASLVVAAIAGLRDGPKGGLIELQKCVEEWEYVLLG